MATENKVYTTSLPHIECAQQTKSIIASFDGRMIPYAPQTFAISSVKPFILLVNITSNVCYILPTNVIGIELVDANKRGHSCRP